MKTPVKVASPEVVEAVVAYAESDAYERDQQRYNELLMRSATDLEFRQRLLTSPMDALAEFYGHEIPEEARRIDIRFIENKGDVTIVLPDPVLLDHELSDTELESVAGGVATPAASAAVSATGSPASAVISAIVSGTLALGAIWLAQN